MKNFTLKTILSSGRLTIGLLILYALLMAIATIVEKLYSTTVAKDWIYFSPLFIALQALMVVNFVCIVVKKKLLRKKKITLLLSHLSFIIILLGALLSHLFGREGILHLRQGEVVSHMRLLDTPDDAPHFVQLPFQVELVKFKLTRYPGSASPSSYESTINIFQNGEKIQKRIFMNNVIDLDEYRLFQSSYDPDELGSVLLVNQDALGRRVTYTGYFLLFVALLYFFFDPNSRFRILRDQLNKYRKIVSFVAALLLPSNLLFSASGDEMVSRVSPVSPAHAQQLATMPMQSSRGRMMPVETFASEVLRKIHHEKSVLDLSPTQFLLSVIIQPDVWVEYPFIFSDNNEVAQTFKLPSKYVSYQDLFDQSGAYKLDSAVHAIYAQPSSEQTKFQKEILKLDERVNILHQLINGQMLHLFPLPGDDKHRWFAPGDDMSEFSGKDSMFVSRVFDWYLSEVINGIQTDNYQEADKVLSMIQTYQQAKASGVDISKERMQAEVFYNRVDIFRWVKMIYLIVGGIFLVISFFSRTKTMRVVRSSLFTLIVLVSLLHVAGIALRWYIAGHAPWSNSYETMVYISWIAAVAGIFIYRRSAHTFALATLFAGVLLFVSALNWMDPQINPLVPVLQSPWLMFHVAVIVAAYGFFGISAFIGISNLIQMSIFRAKKDRELSSRIDELTIINEMSLWFGLVLMTIGTFLGAIWANESWGRYWGWDPKETWALITVVVYAIALHLRFLKPSVYRWWLNFLSVISIYTVLMTYFGVNYFLSGMHSYGQRVEMTLVLPVVGVSLLFVFGLALLSYSYRKQA